MLPAVAYQLPRNSDMCRNSNVHQLLFVVHNVLEEDQLLLFVCTMLDDQLEDELLLVLHAVLDDQLPLVV